MHLGIFRFFNFLTIFGIFLFSRFCNLIVKTHTLKDRRYQQAQVLCAIVLEDNIEDAFFFLKEFKCVFVIAVCTALLKTGFAMTRFS